MAWAWGSNSNTNTAATVAYLSALTSGTLLVAIFRTGGGTPTNVSDPTNGTWTTTLEGPDADGNTLIYAYVISNTSTSAETVTLNGTSLAGVFGIVAEYTYTATSPTLQANSESQNGITSTANSGAITVPSGEMIVIGCGVCGTGVVWTANSPFTLREQNNRCLLQDVLNASPGSEESAATLNLASWNIGGIFVIGTASASSATPGVAKHIGSIDPLHGLVR